jgi:2-polyprenyl-6-methoxyphenol hydroxylase-like FAD-dependent oxidoreductase
MYTLCPSCGGPRQLCTVGPMANASEFNGSMHTRGSSRAIQRIAISGGSLAGLCAAAILLRRGYDVHVYERNTRELSGRGAGLVTHPSMHAALQHAGVDRLDTLGVAVATRRAYGADGGLIGQLPFPQVYTLWDHLYQLLRARVPNANYHLGKAVSDAVETPDGITITFADGTTAVADLLIAADGIRSTIRGKLLPDVTPYYAGYVAWRGLIDEARLSAVAQAALMPFYSFGLPPGEQILAYPVAGPDNAMAAGQRRCNVVWYRPADPADVLPRLLTDDAGVIHRGGIPPPLMAHAVVAEMRADADRLVAPAFAEAMAIAPMPFVQPIYDLAVSRMVFGRIVLIGDAAFVARPHVGAGVTKAVQDALALADALDAGETWPAALAGFERSRLDMGQRIVDRTRLLGASLEANLQGGAGPAATRAAAARFGSVAAILSENASLAFLDKAGQSAG